MEKRLSPTDFIVSKTDRYGKIIYGNQIFIDISGYQEHELIGAPHNILRHPDMPSVIFKLLWERLKNKKEIFAYVKNQCKDGSYYWVFANVTVTTDEQGNIRDYHSVRRQPSSQAMKTIPQMYEKLLNVERTGGVDSSLTTLTQILDLKGMDYDSFILWLQH